MFSGLFNTSTSITARNQYRVVFLTIVCTGGLFCCLTPSFASYEEGVAAYNAGRYADAVKLLNAAKPTNFSNATFHYYLANALVRLNQKADAVREYKLALDLEPGGKLAAYCEAALRTINSTPGQPPPTRTAFVAPVAQGDEHPELQPGLQQATCFSYLCGCPLCARFEIILSDLQVKYGDKIKFIRTTRDSEASRLDAQNSGRRAEYNHCPTVRFTNERGGNTGQYDEKSSEEVIRRDIALLAASCTLSRLAATTDPHLVGTRDAIVQEVQARISSDRVRVNTEIKAVRRASMEASPDRSVQNVLNKGTGVDAMDFTLDSDAKAKIRALEAEFTRKKREWIAEAETKLRALGLTGSAASLAQQFSDSD